jgi:hypothetical protein
MTRYLLTIATLMAALWSCETDLEVMTPSAPTPVVYCILDQDSTMQYLRLSKSYVVKDASVPIGEPDSILFSRATKVAVEEVVGGEVTRRAYFEPVNVVKDSGFFPYRESWVYRAEFPVRPETDYRLVVYIDEFDHIVYSSTYTVGDFRIVNPLYPEVRYIHMLPDHNLSFYWTKSANAAIYQLGFIMHYEEINEDQVEEKEITIPLKSIFYLNTLDNLIFYPINSSNFYGYLAGHLPVSPTALRRFKSIDAIIISGGEELGYYMRIQETGQDFGLMEFSNISNGIGVFSSRVIRRVNDFHLTDQSIDTLAYGKMTNDLNFVDRTGTRRQ